MSETARGTVERVEPTKAQRAVARRMAESKATAPHLYLDTDVAVAGASTELVVHAVARALSDRPRLNGAYRDGAFETYSRVNVGVVVEAGGAVAIPTIFDADTKEPTVIAAELERLIERARRGRADLARAGRWDVHRLGYRRRDPLADADPEPGQAGALARRGAREG